jgi:putative tryptophan/tyrosine transport system substrate-binding protein
MALSTLVAVMVLAAAALTAPLMAAAQPATKVPRVGYLGLESPESPFLEAFRAGLRRLGYVEGRTITIDTRFAEGSMERLHVAASELASLKPDVIVAITGTAALAARKASGTPLVIGMSGDPVEAGLVASLARPGGNITGMTYLQPELGGKRLQLLRDVAPKTSRVAVLMNPNHAGENQDWRAADHRGMERARRGGHSAVVRAEPS